MRYNQTNIYVTYAKKKAIKLSICTITQTPVCVFASRNDQISLRMQNMINSR